MMVYAGSTAYHNCSGAYYQQVSDGYKVVNPPVGAIIPSLPEGANEVVVSGTKYYVYGGAYHRPYYSGGSVIYQIVEIP